MFVDASAAVAIIGGEPDRPELMAKLRQARVVLISPLTLFETTLALARLTKGAFLQAAELANAFVEDTDALIVSVDRRIANLAIEAHEQFGKGRHRASLNMGDCFSYACAKAHRVPLLCKGNDFIHTDIKLA